MDASGNQVTVIGDGNSSESASSNGGSTEGSSATGSGGDTTTGDDGTVAGNQTGAGAVAPVDAGGNQVTVIGDGNTSTGDSTAGDGSASGTDNGAGNTTSGTDGNGSGNQTDAGAAAPVDATGNQVTVIGDGNTADNTRTSEGDTSGAGDGNTTNGENGNGSGNQTDPAATAPVYAGDNQVTVIGDGNTSETADDQTATNGSGGNTTDGQDGTGSGNQTAPGVEAPVDSSDNQVTIIGDGNSTERDTQPNSGFDETADPDQSGDTGGDTGGDTSDGPAGDTGSGSGTNGSDTASALPQGASRRDPLGSAAADRCLPPGCCSGASPGWPCCCWAWRWSPASGDVRSWFTQGRRPEGPPFPGAGSTHLPPPVGADALRERRSGCTTTATRSTGPRPFGDSRVGGPAAPVRESAGDRGAQRREVAEPRDLGVEDLGAAAARDHDHLVLAEGAARDEQVGLGVAVRRSAGRARGRRASGCGRAPRSGRPVSRAGSWRCHPPGVRAPPSRRRTSRGSGRPGCRGRGRGPRSSPRPPRGRG